MTVFWRLLQAVRENIAATIALTREIKLLREDLAAPVPTRAAFTIGRPVEE